jgi:murein DD-endopeptidase MepM/ murein hydrolase activator NlpD
VVSAAYDSGYGYHVVIDHGGGFASLYAHNSVLNVSSGQSVSQGEVIAACGSTGQSSGDHLHFEIRVNGAPQDPLGYLP